MTTDTVDLEGCPRVLAVGGSPRKEGNSDILQDRFLEGARQAGAEVEGIHLRDYEFSPCVGCEACRSTGQCSRFVDGMTPLYDKLVEARGLFLVSPAHNYNLTAWMKGFIDRLYCFYDFEEPRPGPWRSRLANQGRKAVVAAVAEQRSRLDLGFTLDGMRRPLEALGYEVVGELPVLGVFERGGVRDHPEILDAAHKWGARLTRALQPPEAAADL